MSSKYSQMEETKVIDLAQKGDSEAMGFLMEKYKGLVRAISRPMFLIDGDQDDLIQEGMIGLFKAIQTYHKDKGTVFETFAHLCISSQLYSAIKASNRKKNIPLNSYISIDSMDNGETEREGESGFLLDKTFADWQKNPEEIVIGQEAAKAMESRLFSRLSNMEKEVLGLFLKGLTYKEIAENLDKSPKTIDNALQRIKTKLAKFQA